MKRLLLYGGLPNVISHDLTEKVFNPIAKIFGIQAPSRRLKNVKWCLTNKKANLYLSRQFTRLRKYAKNGNFGAFDFLMRKILTSYSFQLQAYNSVFPKWLTVKRSTVKKQLRYIRKLCHQQSTDLVYKRVWIDKNPGDFARPLGVPNLPWRVYLRMLLNIGEIYADGKGLYSNFQHGGRPGFGVMTCLAEMIEKSRRADRIFEFDFKGFFDHLNKDAVRYFFAPLKLSLIYFQILQVKPQKYVMPPIEADQAVKNIDKIISEPYYLDVEMDEVGLPLKENTLYQRNATYTREQLLLIVDDPRFDFVRLSVHHSAILDEPVGLHYPSGLEPNLEGGISASYGGDMFTESSSGWSLNDAPDLEYGRDYSRAMSNTLAAYDATQPFKHMKVAPLKPMERELARDEWKELNLTEQGIPQGTAIGPFLASTITAYQLRHIKNLLLYVDDGMIFLNKGEDYAKRREELEDALKPIGIELAPLKSHLRSRSSLLVGGLKFLGTRSFLKRYFTAGNADISMRSETRGGIQRWINPEFPDIEHIDQALDQLLTHKVLTFSKFRLLRWLVKANKSRLKKALTSELLSAAIKWNFFGNLLAEAYNPGNSIEDLKLLIKEGMAKAYEDMRRDPNSLGTYFLAMPMAEYLTERQNPLTKETEVIQAFSKPDLFNLSTFAIQHLLLLGKGWIQKDFGKDKTSEARMRASLTGTMLKDEKVATRLRFLTYSGRGTRKLGTGLYQKSNSKRGNS